MEEKVKCGWCAFADDIPGIDGKGEPMLKSKYIRCTSPDKRLYRSKMLKKWASKFCKLYRDKKKTGKLIIVLDVE